MYGKNHGFVLTGHWGKEKTSHQLPEPFEEGWGITLQNWPDVHRFKTQLDPLLALQMHESESGAIPGPRVEDDIFIPQLRHFILSAVVIYRKLMHGWSWWSGYLRAAWVPWRKLFFLGQHCPESPICRYCLYLIPDKEGAKAPIKVIRLCSIIWRSNSRGRDCAFV